MKFIIVFAAIIACVVGGTVFPKAFPVQPRNLKSFGGRIVGGTAAGPNQFPWQVAITANGRSFCGGSIINAQWVLTAAHCTDGLTSFSIAFGSNTLNPSGLVMVSNRVVQHPGYNSNNLNNDISLIQLPSSLTFTNSIQPVRLPTRSQESNSFVGLRTTVSGFGLTSDGSSSVSNTLNQVDIRIISNVDCQDVYGPNTIIQSTICGRGWNQITQSTCSGDSGGPLVIYENGTPTQIGVVSFVSSRGCASGDPSGYVRTASFLTWISQQTGIAVQP